MERSLFFYVGLQIKPVNSCKKFEVIIVIVGS